MSNPLPVLKRDNNVTNLNASGSGTNIIQNNNAATTMVVVALSVITVPAGTGATTCKLTPPTGIIDTSYFAGTGDVAYGVYFLPPGDSITLTWTNGPASGQGVATYQYFEYGGPT